MSVCVCADYQSDSDSFNPTLWEEQRQQRMTVAFDFEDKKEEEDSSGKVKVSSSSMFQSVCLPACLSVCLSQGFIWGSQGFYSSFAKIAITNGFWKTSNS